MDSVTETSSVGLFGRLRNSFMATLFGLLMVPGSIVLLYWNEGRAVTAIRALDQGQHQLVEADPKAINAALDGHLVHLSGMADTSSPASDDSFGVTGPNLLRVARKVEMYQWRESSHSSSHTEIGGTKTTTTTYDYEQVWSETPINSGGFHSQAGHANPEMPL
ncbi:MAG TPA: TMEM43 family protein, partial [Nevskia sp.]|nr:TMEM43 family protein [Nevskia sp.]